MRLIRCEDVSLSLAARGKIARDWPADVMISNHVNNVGDPEVRGLELFHSIHSSPEPATAIAEEILALDLIPPRTGDLAVVQVMNRRNILVMIITASSAITETRMQSLLNTGSSRGGYPGTAEI